MDSYWKGDAKEALDIARELEDRDLIIFALLKYREELKADDRLTSDEKQQEIDEIQTELTNKYKNKKPGKKRRKASRRAK